MLEETKCVVPNIHFTESPFLIEWASLIKAKVIASNWLGDGPESEMGTGARIYRVPDKPINLVNKPSVTKGNLIGIEW